MSYCNNQTNHARKCGVVGPHVATTLDSVSSTTLFTSDMLGCTFMSQKLAGTVCSLTMFVLVWPWMQCSAGNTHVPHNPRFTQNTFMQCCD